MPDDKDLGLPPLNDHDAGDTPPARSRQRRTDTDLPYDRLTEEDLKIQQILNNEDYSGGNLEISRKDATSKWCFLSTIPIADWNDDSKVQIAREYGGGEYRARVRTGGGQMGAAFLFNIDKAVKPQTVQPAAGATPFDLLKQAKEMSGDSTPLLMQLMQQNEQRSMQFMQMMMKQQQDSMNAMVAMITKAPAAQPESNAKLVEILLTHALKPVPAAPALDLNAMLDFATKIQQLGGGVREGADDGEPEKEDGGGEIIKGLMKALPLFLNALPQMRAQPAPVLETLHPGAETVKPAPQPAASAGAPPPPELFGAAEAAGANKAALAEFLPQLVPYAAQQAPADQVADTIRAILAPDQLGGIVKLLGHKDWLAILIDAHQPVAVHSNWFIKLREELTKGGAIDIDEVPAPAA